MAAGIAAETLERASRGEESAWQVIVASYGRRIFALAKSRVGCRERAEEITQSIFVTLAEKLREDAVGSDGAGYTERGKFEPWLFKVAMNRIRDFGRRLSRESLRSRSLDLQRAGTEPLAPVDGSSPSDREFDALREAIAELPEADREVVELRHHADLSFKQISSLLDEPIGTLLARHHRALRKLRTTLETREGGTHD